MVMFHSYVSLPEGNNNRIVIIQLVPTGLILRRRNPFPLMIKNPRKPMPILEPWNCLGIYVNFRGMGLSGFKRRYLWDLTNPAGYKLKFNGKTLKDDETLRQHKVQIPTRQNVG